MGLDEKILSISLQDPVYNGFQDLNQIPKHILLEISEFFKTYKNLEDPKYAVVKEWQGVEEAHKIITNSIDQFKNKYGDIATINPI